MTSERFSEGRSSGSCSEGSLRISVCNLDWSPRDCQETILLTEPVSENPSASATGEMLRKRHFYVIVNTRPLWIERALLCREVAQAFELTNVIPERELTLHNGDMVYTIGS